MARSLLRIVYRSRWALGLGALALAVGWSAAQAQEPAGARVEIASVATATYPDARAVVTIEGIDSGQPITAQDIAATLDRTPVDVTAADLASSQNLPLDVLIVMDVSGSMKGAPIDAAKKAAADLVGGLAPSDRVAVIAYSDDVRLIQDFTTDRAPVLAGLDGLKAGGYTALFKATQAAAYLIAKSPASRRVAILLSDGEEDNTAHTTTREEALAAAAGAGAPFFAIGEGTALDRDYLTALASQTRGRYLEAPDPGSLAGLYAGIGKLLSSQYVVTFDASNAHDGSALTLDFTINGQTVPASATFSPAAGFGPAAVTLSGVTEGEALSQARGVSVDVGVRPNAKATFYLDDVVVAELKQPPYLYDIDPAKLASGAHKLRVVVSDADGSHATEAALSFSAAVAAGSPDGGGGGSGLPLLPIAGGVGALIALALVIFAVLRVKGMRSEDAESDARMMPWANAVPSVRTPQPATEERVEQESIGEALGLLISRSGPDLGSEYAVGGSPVSIGSGARCGVRVNDPDLGAEEARIWIRKGQLMVHRITKLTNVVNDGSSGGWMILDPSDTFEIGQHRFEFRLMPEGYTVPTPQETPNVLRDAPARPVAGSDAGTPPRQVPPPRPSTFSELMPRNDVGTNRD